MTIGKKISHSCAGLVALSLCLGAFSLWNMSRIENRLQTIVTDSLPGIYEIGKLESAGKDIRGTMLMHVASSDEREKAELESTLTALQQRLRQGLQSYEKTIITAEDRELYQQIPPALDHFLQVWQPIQAVSRSGDSKQALAMFRQQAWPAFAEVQKVIGAEIDFNKRGADKTAADATSATSFARWASSILLAIALLLGSGIAVFLTRGINRSLARAASALRE